MAQFHVYDIGRGRLVLDLQSDWLDLGSRVVAPLLRSSKAPPRVRNLTPEFAIDGTNYTLLTAKMAAIPAVRMRSPLGNLTPHDYDIRKALDMVFSGF